MIITRIKIVAAAASLMFGITNAQANMLENLVDAANGALPSYGRADTPNLHTSNLSVLEISDAVRELLLIGCENAVKKLQQYGYNNPSVRIDLPKHWRKARKIAARIGYSAEFDKLERRLAEVALEVAPATGNLLAEMISDLDIPNPIALLGRGDDAATLELRSQVVSRLTERLEPIVNESLRSAGVLKLTSEIDRHVRHFPVARLIDTDFTDHVVAQSLDGFFHYLAMEERFIRTRPLEQQSDLLRRVFG